MTSAQHRLFGLDPDDLLALLYDIPLGLIVVVRESVTHVYMNRCAGELLGLSTALADAVELETLPDEIRVIGSGGDGALAQWLLQELENQHQRQHDVSLMRPGAEAVDLLVNVGCLERSASERMGCVITFMDVTGEKRLGRQLARRAAQQSLAASFSNALLMNPEHSEVVRQAADTMARGLQVELALYLEHDSDSGTLRVTAVAGEGARDGPAGAAESLAEPTEVGRAFLERRTVVMDPHAATGGDPPLGLQGMQCSIATPVWDADGPIGVLACLVRQPTTLPDHDLRFAESIAVTASNGLSRMIAEMRYLDSVRQLERARATERVNRAARLSSLGTMASGIAHEVKNPINAIHVNAELAKVLISETGDTEQAEACLDRIKADCQRAAEIADGILGFARGAHKLEREMLTAGELFAGISRLAASVPGLAGIDLDFEVRAPDTSLAVNRTEFEQAIVNLAQNSVEAGAGAVVVDADCLDRELVIQVSDDGPGIPDEIRSRLFDPFFTTRDKSGGSGLGLSLVHRIVSDHGGHIDVENLPARGCRFTICLPLEAGRD